MKIIQEVISLLTFSGFAILHLGEYPRWNDLVALALILGAVLIAFWPMAPLVDH